MNAPLLGPRSKYDRSLPYLYEARVDALAGQAEEPLDSYYQCDTICGLVQRLDEAGVDPGEVRLFGLYLGHELELETELCTNDRGAWLKRPFICRAIEAHYRVTLDQRYRGHVADATCAFDDRDKQGEGPF